MAFNDDVVTQYNNRRGSSDAIDVNQISVADSRNGLATVRSDYTTAKPLLITLIGDYDDVLADLAGTGMTHMNRDLLQSMFEPSSCGTIKSFTTSGSQNRSLIVHGGNAYVIAAHSNYDLFLTSAVLFVGKKVADTLGETDISDDLEAAYVASKSNW